MPETPAPTFIFGRMRKPVGGCNVVRMEEPLGLIGQQPGVRVHLDHGPIRLSLHRPEERRLFVWQRPIVRWPADAGLLRGLLQHGYLIVHELDDWPEHAGYADNGFIGFRAVHAVQVSTPAIAEFARRFNPHVAVFPNQLAALPPRQPARARDEVVLFFGALNRTADAQAILPALNRVLAARPNLRVDVIHDEGFFQGLATARKTFRPLCAYDVYRRTLGHSDIAVLPLADTPFNRAKSDLKFLEAAAEGVAVLASPTVYAASIDPGRTGLLFHDAEEFERQLLRLVDDPALRASLADAAHAHVAAHRMLDRHADSQWAWYDGLLARQKALTADLFRRTPELAG
ncbi:MAG TPA: glycosyltransferase [Azospirillum sp.]